MITRNIAILTALSAAGLGAAISSRGDDVISGLEPSAPSKGPRRTARLLPKSETQPKQHTHSREIARRLRQEARHLAKQSL